jgi:acetolactate synthase-1/2/3 large subunit
MNGSEFFAEALHAYGVTHVFFVPYVATPALARLDALGVRRVSTHSEVSAAYMADGYARATHRPGVCLGQAIGAINLAAGLRDAYLGCSPVVAISGGPHPDSRYRFLYQQIEDFPMFESVTKFNARVESPERLPDLLRQAFRVATTGTPGPVHLEFPGRLGEGVEGGAGLDFTIEPEFGAYPPFRPEPELAAVEAAADALAAAERPVIVAGGGVVASGAEAEVVQLAEQLGIPVATSLNGKQTILDRHPLALGLVGMYGRWCANRAVANADLVFFIGSRTGGMTTENWTAPRFGMPTIQLDIDPAAIGRNYPAQVSLLGDARTTLCRLNALVHPRQGQTTRWLEWTSAQVQAWRDQVEPPSHSAASPLRPEVLCRVVSEVLPSDAIVVTDTGHIAQWAGMHVNLSHPNQRYIRCSGTLGWGLPGAMGVKCGAPDRPVVCLTGDGGLYYYLAELETAARLGIDLVVVVNNNSSLSQTKPGYDAAYGGQPYASAHELWKYRDTDFAAVAETLGCLGLRVERAEHLRGAVERALAARRPAVVDVVTDLDALPVGPWG